MLDAPLLWKAVPTLTALGRAFFQMRSRSGALISESMFYTFKQNNTGGSFKVDEASGIGHVVVIEANDVKQANARAEQIGIYFNGCDDDRDCPCCGDRWSEAYDFEDLDAVPSMYGKPIEPGYEWFGGPTFIHPLRGPFYKA